jgi:osmotically-inducible protein OsmY
MTDSTAHLHGRLPSLTALQRAVKAAEATDGVMAVESRIVVTPEKLG